MAGSDKISAFCGIFNLCNKVPIYPNTIPNPQPGQVKAQKRKGF